ncbi:MAG: hypothetical protein GX020_03785 [Firmicutes bacterium]|jgi:uncharacterized protein YqgV (UPF0045/DUF77 family)|nr:hypothetical protein [Bacillota bacterium]
MAISAEISLYPVNSRELDHDLLNSTTAFRDYDFHYDFGSLRTQVFGEPDEIWNTLRSLFEQAQVADNEVVMVVTISNMS